MLFFISSNRAYAWTCAGALLCLIYATLGIVRPIVNYLKQTNTLSIVVWSLISLFIILLIYLLINFKVKGYTRYALLVVLFCIYGMSLKYLIVAPEERIHFIEYGLLSLLIFNAFSLDIKKKWLIFVLTFVLVSLAGYIDELIQYMLPSRYYDIRDVGINSLSGFLMLVFIGIISFNSNLTES